MGLSPGARIGGYEVAGILGAGGMGEVYRARDLRLGRDVALKVLPLDLAGDADRVVRFEREAKTLAALNHPHIAQVYGVENDDDTIALAMELVAGEDLSQVLARGPVPMSEALAIADQIAEALEAAHAAGIVHRDLKPANIKQSADGIVKVLDFGLAKALEPALPPAVDAAGVGGAEVRGARADSPTITTPAVTRAGVILGTAAYMSPEQARGKPVDRRTDIWAFGCVVFELLTGRRAFEGETMTDVLAAIVGEEPNWTLLPTALPRPVRHALQRCLEKDARKRVSQIAVVRYALELRDASASESPPVAAEVSRRLFWRKIAVAALTALAFGAGWAVHPSTSVAPTGKPVRFDLNLPDAIVLAPTGASAIADMALSPDASVLAFAGLGGEGSNAPVLPGDAPDVVRNSRQLWFYRMDTGDFRALPGTLGAVNPMWSPDGRQLAFTTPSGDVRFVSADGIAIQRAATIPRDWGATLWGGTWGSDGVILLGNRTPVAGRGLLRVNATTAEVSVETRCEDPCEHHILPAFLDDGRRYVFAASSNERGVYLATVGSARVERILSEISSASFGAGHLLHVDRGRGVVLATPFNTRSGKLTGISREVGGPVGISTSTGRASFAASRNGSIAWSAAAGSHARLTLVNRRGEVIRSLGIEGLLHTMKVSPDGTRVAYGRVADGDIDQELWVSDLTRQTATRLTFLRGIAGDPSWSPDASAIAFTSGAAAGVAGRRSLKIVAASGGTPREVVLPPGAPYMSDWTPNGEFLLFHSAGLELWEVRPDGSRPRSLLKPAAGRIDQASVSPDGKWLAFSMEESGRPEIYVTPFPPGGPRWQVSTDGGVQPRWSRAGGELFFLGNDGTLRAAAVKRVAAGLEFGRADPLFRIGFAPSFGIEQYDVMPDGQTFVVMQPRDEGRARSVITIWLNAIGESPSQK